MINVLNNDYAALPDGVMVEIKGKEIAMVRHVRDMKPADDAPDRADGLPARAYSHFAVGGRGFTIDDQSQADIDLLKDKQQKKTIASIMLETSSYQRPELDENKNVIPGEFTTVKSFRFVAIVTVEDAISYAQSEGKVAKEEAIWAPKPTNVITDDKLSKMITASLTNLLPGAIAAALPAPVAAQPAAEVVA